MNNLLPSATCVACHCSDTMQQPTSTSNILNYTQSFGAIHNNLLTLYGETFPDLIGTHEQIWQFMTTETTKELNTVNLPGANFISFSDANLMAGSPESNTVTKKPFMLKASFK